MLTLSNFTLTLFCFKGKDDMFEKLYHDKRRMLKVEPDVDLADLLAAREDLAIMEKTSSVSVRKNTRTQLNKVIIGTVRFDSFLISSVILWQN